MLVDYLLNIVKELKTFKNRNLKNLYRNGLDKVRFAHDGAYFNGKDLAKATILDKVVKESTYEVGRNYNYDRYQKALASIA